MAASALAPLLAGSALGGTTTVGALFGSALSGAASGWMKSMQEKKAEKAKIEEEKRRAAQYEGLGKATGWSEANAQRQQTKAQEIAAAPALGQNPDMVGQKYIERAERNKTKMPKYRYDRKTRMIETG